MTLDSYKRRSSPVAGPLACRPRRHKPRSTGMVAGNVQRTEWYLGGVV